MKILLVDDDPHFAGAIEELLVRAGHEVAIAWDGAQALSAVGRVQPDAVIVDFKMPGFNGAVTSRMLRSFAPDAPIIGVSGVAEIDTEWADVFLPKHDVLDRLLDVIADLREDP